MFQFVRMVAVAGFVIASGVSAASAAVLDFTDVSGLFSNGTGRNGNPVASAGDSITWGTAVKSSPFNSRYSFAGDATVSGDEHGFTFNLGMFTHRNGTIKTNEGNLDSVDLTLEIAGTLAGLDFSLTRNLGLSHVEALDVASPCPTSGGNPCRDSVLFTAFEPFSFSTTADGKIYTVNILGFYDAEFNGELITSLFTPEKDYSYAWLRGSLTITEASTVPLPASLPLLGAALLAGGWLSRRRRAA